jgi:hypothetical protein
MAPDIVIFHTGENNETSLPPYHNHLRILLGDHPGRCPFDLRHMGFEVSAPRGVQHPTLKVAGDKDTYHGVLTGQRGQVPIKEIQVEEKTFGFPLKVTTPMGEFELHYCGQIDGDLHAFTTQLKFERSYP